MIKLLSPDILIPAIISLVIGLGAHIVSLSINRNKTSTMKDIRGYDSLETQLGNVLDENRNLEVRLQDKDTKTDELREVKYDLELKIALLDREIASLKETLKASNEENFQLRTELSMLREQNGN